MLNLAIIGTGRYGVNIIHAFKQLEYQNIAKLVSICDINEDVLNSHCKKYKVKGYTDYRKMLDSEDIDAVAIATPDHLHKEPCIYAAKSGRHIFVQKPMDITVEGCLEILEEANKSNVLIQVDFHKRYDPYHQQLCKDVKSGKFGTIEYGYVHMEDRIEVPSKWFSSWAHKSSPVWFLGVHFIDLVRWCLGSNGKSAYATGYKMKLKKMGIDTYDSVSAKVIFENGVSVTFDVSWILPENFEAIVNQSIRFVGTEGIIECDTQDRGTRLCSTEKGMETYNIGFILETKDVSGRTVYKGYGIESIMDFVYNLIYIKNGGDFETLRKNSIAAFGEDGLEVTRIAVAIHESLQKDEPVSIR
ncbi:MAG: Gfo/Idh/MocA family oxidoreductase [bacterium]|nr:Gfo/Idh/MocA family oxidoreductase [bacterium]